MTYGSTPRTEYLRNNIVSKACYEGNYEDGIFVDVSRAKLHMESYRQTEGEEPVLRRAKALGEVLDKISIDILPRELIVGNPHADPHALPIFPEVNTGLLAEALDDGYLCDEDRETAQELLAYWSGKTIQSKVGHILSDEIRDIVDQSSSFISTTWKDGIQHCVPNWNYVFEHGTSKIREKIERRLAEVDEVIQHQNSTDLRHLIEARLLFEAMLISLDGLDNYVHRYSKLAAERAEGESDPDARADLKKIAASLSTTLKDRPRGFLEACQGFYFLHLILNCIDSTAFGSLVRLDQALWPFYKHDVLEKKLISRSEAQEIVECLMIKIQTLGGFFSRKRRLHFEGNGALPIWSIGGLHSDGTDACNELSDVILQAAQAVHLNQPTISMMYHKEMRESTLEEALKAIGSGLGYPSLTNVDWMVDSLVRQGMTPEVARNSGTVGCVSVCPVDSCNTTKRLALTIIAAKSLELALNEGKCLITGKQLGPVEKPAAQFASFDELYAAVEKQIDFSVKTAVNVRNITRHYEMKERPNPLASALHKSPLEKGIDAVCYEDYPNNYWLNMVGLINIVNGLAAIKQLVFDEKKYELSDFVEAMHNNWQDREPMRQEVINKVPKFGNDVDQADQLAQRVFETCSQIAQDTKDINGGYWSIVAQSVAIYQATAGMIGALPDGKLAGMPVADGGISPEHGTDKEGIFSVLSSVGKVDHAHTKGLLLNQWISPELIRGDDGIKWGKAMLDLWGQKQISQSQFNVVDPVVLRKAQEHPEQYPNLTVRVSGYTANWVKLTPELQEIILSRTCQDR